jgi:GcrA cell cycle regulator
MTKPLRYAEDCAKSSRSTRGCNWPIGNPGEKGFRFCGVSTPTGRVYCAEHNEKAFAKPQGRTPVPRSIGPSWRK